MYLRERHFARCGEHYVTFPAMHSGNFRPRDAKLYCGVVRIPRNARGRFDREFHVYTRLSALSAAREERRARKNIRGGADILAKGPSSLPFLYSFLPSFLPPMVRYETTRCIFPPVITCTFYYLVFVSPPYTVDLSHLPHPAYPSLRRLSPNIPCLRHITRHMQV